MERLNIIVVGTVGSDPYAGMAWMTMQIVQGFRRLGHNVFYFETTSTWPYDPKLETRVDVPDYALAYLSALAEKFGLQGKWAYRSSYTSGKDWYGLSAQHAERLLAGADLVFNIAGATRFAEEGLKTGRLVYFGTDPVYHEIRYSQGDPVTKSIIDEHTDVVTYGENIGNPDCPIPALPGLRGRTRQPVILDHWSPSGGNNGKYTTVGNWKQSGRDLIFNGERYYWSKHHEHLRFIKVPLQVSQPIQMALNLAGIQSGDGGEGTEIPSMGVARNELDLLQDNGWELVDAPSFTTDPWLYRDYIQRSAGEFSFAKDQNIRLRSGWFSERSACYLAAGKPVITQDTAFGCSLPTGIGLFAFNNEEEILAAFEAVSGNYRKHSLAAREIAETYFKAEIVLAKLLKDLGA